MYKREFIGEFIGTFLLVLFGCGSVAVSVLFDSHQGLFQIAAIWGISVSLAIYATRHLSCAHLNPAVTLAMVATSFENANGIVRGATESVQTARIFGWGQAAFPDRTGGFFFVYMLAPVLGGQIAALLFTSVLEPLMKTRNEDQCYCGNKKTYKIMEVEKQ